MYAIVSFPISSYKTFTYRIPEKFRNKILLGTCVNAPINHRIQIGFIVAVSSYTEYKGKILKIDSIIDSEFHISKELWLTIEWISKYYITPIGQVLKAAVPNSFIKTYQPKKIKYAIITKLGLKLINEINTKNSSQIKVLNALSSLDEPIKISLLSRKVSSPYSVCNVLENKGLINTILKPKLTDPCKIMGLGTSKKIVLTKEQQQIIDTIKLDYNSYHPYLLHGVTGSGKTEVYLKLAQKMVKSNKSVLVLVPEISLTPQVGRRFRKAFGSNVAIWHSRMTKAEKGWTWQQLKKGQYSVVIGARSAIFTPLSNLGLIIVDEEQESTYKQENPPPRYNARDVAIVRAKNANAIVLLTSATPCLESYYNALQNKFTLLKLNKRFGESRYPEVKIIDMKKEYSINGNPVISSNMINAIENKINKSEQVIILQNRRGHSQIQQCLDCGEITMCESCSVTMTLHQTDNKLHCHYCQTKIQCYTSCLFCQSNNIVFKGIGTQQVEEVLMEQLPVAKILRMDLDTVKKKGAHQKILDQFINKEADILLGTQMIAKGLDFDNVTLVCIVNADLGLFFPDYRSGERVFQIIYQVAGRSGRRKKPGQVIIQTYNPNDIYIKTASTLDIHKFYNIELAQRQELNYPPFCRICRIIFIGKNKNMIENISEKIANKLLNNKDYIILGPTSAPIEKIKNNWRVHIVIKTKDKSIKNIHQFLYNKIGFSIFERKWKGIQIQIDIDPISML